MLINNACSKNSKIFLISLLALGMISFSAMAQEPAAAEPPQADLPSAAAPAEASVPDAEEGALTEDAAAVKTDPCPIPATELGKTPDDLAKIQADIDRYTLCMERAQLLEQLNALAMENQEKLNEASGISGENPGMQLERQLPDFDEQRQRVIDNINQESEQAMQEEEEPDSTEWMILRVSGSAGGLAAQLGKADGTMARVHSGDELPDGSSVDMVSATSVKITQDGESKNLRWIESASAEDNNGL